MIYVRRDDGGLEVWLERRESQPREMMGQSRRRREGAACRGPHPVTLDG